MPMLMEKSDWARAISGLKGIDRVWQEDVSGDADDIRLSLPEVGTYRVYLVKIDEPRKRRHSARNLIGYGRKYGGEPRTAEDWLHEIREGDGV